MSTKEFLMNLEDPLRRISCGINAIELMMYGLGRTKDPYADGFFVIWNYLREAEADLQKAVQAAEE